MALLVPCYIIKILCTTEQKLHYNQSGRGGLRGNESLKLSSQCGRPGSVLPTRQPASLDLCWSDLSCAQQRMRTMGTFSLRVWRSRSLWCRLRMLLAIIAKKGFLTTGVPFLFLCLVPQKTDLFKCLSNDEWLSGKIPSPRVMIASFGS